MKSETTLELIVGEGTKELLEGKFLAGLLLG
jgi:hypothetical protein